MMLVHTLLILIFLYITPVHAGVSNESNSVSLLNNKRPVLVIAINPLDCPACFLGYKKVNEELSSDFGYRIQLILPEDAKYAASKIFKERLNEDYNKFKQRTLFNDSLLNRFLYNHMSSVNIVLNDSILWQQSIKDFGTQVNNNHKPLLVDQYYIQDSVFNKSSVIELLNDSMVCIINPMNGALTIYRIDNMSMVYTFHNDDTSFIKFLYRSIEDKKTRDFNLAYISDTGNLADKYGFIPLNFLNVFYRDNTLWISAKLLVVKKDISDDNKLLFYPNSFISTVNLTTRKQNAYSLPYCFPNSNVCPYPAFFYITDENKLLLPNSSGNFDSLFSIFSISDKQIQLDKIIPFALPNDLPKKNAQGFPIFYMPVIIESPQMPFAAIYSNATIYNLMNVTEYYKISSLDSLLGKGYRILAASALGNDKYIICLSKNKEIQFHILDRTFTTITKQTLSYSNIINAKYHSYRKLYSIITKNGESYKVNVFKFL